MTIYCIIFYRWLRWLPNRDRCQRIFLQSMSEFPNSSWIFRFDLEYPASRIVQLHSIAVHLNPVIYDPIFLVRISELLFFSPTTVRSNYYYTLFKSTFVVTTFVHPTTSLTSVIQLYSFIIFLVIQLLHYIL